MKFVITLNFDAIGKKLHFLLDVKIGTKIESNNLEVALNTLFYDFNVDEDKLGITQVYNSEYNLEREKQVVLLIILDDQTCHYQSNIFHGEAKSK